VTVDGAAEGQVFDEIGYTMSSSNIAAESFAGLAWVHLSADPSPKGRRERAGRIEQD
jgi:hypothetical protein